MIRLRICSVAVSLAFGMYFTPALAQQQSSAAQEGPEPSLLESRIEILRGTIVPSRTIKLPDGQSVTFPESCTFKFVLPPDKNALHWHDRGKPTFHKNDVGTRKHFCEGAFEVGVPQKVAPPKTEVVTRASWRHAGGYYHMWWTDPVGAAVNYVRATVQWYWDTSGVENYLLPESTFWEESWWPTGWELLSHWHGDVTGGSDYGITGALYLRNMLFPPCTPATPMFLYYDPVQVFGAPNGYLYGYGNTVAQGPGLCYLLLTPHREIVRTIN